MKIDPSAIPPRTMYSLMTSAIMPRPIAWVSTISASGRTNLAPFSFFQGVTASPPTLLIIPVNDREGKKKDTARNIDEVPEFVVNIVSFDLAQQMNETAAPLPHGESEFDRFNITSAPSLTVRPPRVAAAPVSFECTLHQVVSIGEGPLAANVIFGLIRMIHIDDSVVGADGIPDPAKMDLVGRLGGDLYSRTTDRFAVKRPTA